jgi:hypothetical protein
MENPGGKFKGYMRVGVRVWMVLPLAYPYPLGGYRGHPSQWPRVGLLLKPDKFQVYLSKTWSKFYILS